MGEQRQEAESHAWTVDEMRKGSGSWSLASDAGVCFIIFTSELGLEQIVIFLFQVFCYSTLHSKILKVA